MQVSTYSSVRSAWPSPPEEKVQYHSKVNNMPTPHLDFTMIQKLVRTTLHSPKVSVRHLERICGSSNQIYLMQTSDNEHIILKIPPREDSSLRLMRLEQHRLETESRALHLITTNSSVPVPRRLRYYNPKKTSSSSSSSSADLLSTPCLLRSYLPGQALSAVSHCLTPTNRATIDRQIGTHMRSLASLAAPSFGPTPRVFDNAGHPTWRDAFLSMLESALRDAEDMLLNLPYDAIRAALRTHAHALDPIREARIVPLDAGLDSNVLVSDHARGQDSQVVGMLAFSNVVWGDITMSEVFLRASEPFWDGFGRAVREVWGYRERVLLYAVYRAVVEIVRHHCRPDVEDGDLRGRRTLTWALDGLARCS